MTHLARFNVWSTDAPEPPEAVQDYEWLISELEGFNRRITECTTATMSDILAAEWNRNSDRIGELRAKIAAEEF